MSGEKETTADDTSRKNNKKKRTSERQITKDDYENGEEDKAGEADAGDDKKGEGTFEKASAEVLKERRILKARRSLDSQTSTQNEDDDTKPDSIEDKKSGGNPFVSVSLSPAGKAASEGKKNPFASATFGSGTAFVGGFGSSKAVGFGSSPSGSSMVGFGSAVTSGKVKPFGASPSSGFFGNKKGVGTVGFGSPLQGQSKSIFGSPQPKINSQSSTGAAVPSPSIFAPRTPKTPIATPKREGEEDEEVPGSSSVSNGEEGWDIIFQTRAKLFRLVPKVQPASPGDKTTDLAAEHSVPPSAASATKRKQKSNSNLKEESIDQQKKEGEEKEENQQPPKMDWKEVGIGPLRILQPANSTSSSTNEKESDSSPSDSSPSKPSTMTRIVQRRESTPGGPGTKLILNINLRKEGQVLRQAEKFVRLATAEVDTSDVGENKTKKESNESKKEEEKEVVRSVMYLFKVKTVSDADELQKHMEEGIKRLS